MESGIFAGWGVLLGQVRVREVSSSWVILLVLWLVSNDFRAADASAGAAVSSSASISGFIFVVVTVQIAWNATNALYELA